LIQTLPCCCSQSC